MDNWIKINSASDETRDAIDSVAEVLKDMGIDLVYDDEQATKDNVDLFIRLNHTEETLKICPDCDRVLPEEYTRCWSCENKHGREVG